MKKSLICAAAALSLLASSCKKSSKEPSDEVEVKTLTAKKCEENVTIETFGAITYKMKNDISSLVDGTIVERNVQEGSIARKGQILLKMKNIQYEIQKAECQNKLNSAQARLKAAQNNLIQEERSVLAKIMSLENAETNLAQKKEEANLLQRNLEKSKRLFDAGGISESALEQMALDAKAAQTEIEVLEKELKMQSLGYNDKDLIFAGIQPSEDDDEKKSQLVDLNTQSARIEIELANVEVQNAERNLESINALMENLTVRAERDGIVGAVYFERGERVTQNQTLMTIIDMEKPYAKVPIQERDLEKIQLGSKALVEINSAKVRQNSAVEFISPMADSESGNFFVKIPVNNSDEKIRLGMFAKCLIETKASGEFFALPESALLRRDGNTAFFYCVKNDFIYQKECPIEMEKDGKIFIASGLKDGEQIIERPKSTLKEGLRVKTI